MNFYSTQMKTPAARIALAIFLSSSFFACSPRSEGPLWTDRSVIIGIPANVTSFNPLYAADVTSAEINELVYPMLVSAEFDTVSGALIYTPLLARSWESERNGRDVVFHLRNDAKWADGKPVRAKDVQFTYSLYADPEVGSVWQDALESLLKEKDGRLVIQKAIEIRNDSTIVFHFQRVYSSQLFDAGLPIVPEHLFSRIPRKDLRTHAINRKPVGAGPFSLSEQSSTQEVVLVPNGISQIGGSAKLERLIFRTVPDYRTRVLQLRAGEIDMMSSIELEDVKLIERENPEIRILVLPSRRYHFIGWNNIEPISWTDGGLKSVRPHALFGSAKVRRALTMAIHRSDISAALLGPFATPAVGPIAPIFPWAQNTSIRPVAYDPKSAQALLAEEGWIDRDGDGILDKNGKPFAFVLRVPGGNTLWSEIAAVVQQQLRAIKIDAIIQQTERAVFWADLINKKYDAWVAGFEVPLEVRLDDMWNSDLETHPFNVMSYRNPNMDRLLKKVRAVSEPRLAAQDLKEIQSILAADQPCTFLFWERGRIAHNRRVLGIRGSIIAMTNESWNWHVIPAR